MERVKRVEDLNIRIIDAQGTVDVGAVIRIFIAWFRVGAFPRMARDGSRAARTTSCPYQCSHGCFERRLFVDISGRPLMPETCSSCPLWNHFGPAMPFCDTSLQFGKRTGSSMPNHSCWA
jgi:hypothetical protein